MIDRIEMINWRKYDEREISFRPGVNFIVGANGAGKTSILEAIAVALTGEPSTLSDRSKLLRNPNQVAKVDLTFTVDGQTYRVERSQSDTRALPARLYQVGWKKALATGNRNVTAEIEQIMNVSVDFWRRVVYMAEGDVFHFLNSPPGNALDAQLQRLVGLNQFNEFEVALKRAQRDIQKRIKALMTPLDQLHRLQITTDEALSQQIAELDQHLAELISSVESMSKGQVRLEQENKLLVQWIGPLVNKILLHLQHIPQLAPLAKQLPVLELETQVREQIETLEASQQALLQSNQTPGTEGYQQLETLLMSALPAPDSHHTSPCPLCGKPIRVHERASVQQHIQAFVSGLQQKKQQFTESLSDINQQIKPLRELLNVFVSLSHQLQLTSFIDPTTATLLDIQKQIETFADYYAQNNKGDHLRSHTETLKANQQQKSSYLNILNQLGRLGFNSIAEAQAGLLQLETRYLSIRAAQEAVKQTITLHRNRDIEPVYEQIAQVWQNVASGDYQTWQIKLDATGMPILSNAEGREFTLNQFSGGEKTALLVMLHTIVAHHFSKGNFLLIDEPLEHLDPVNRRSLIRFLIEAYHKGAFKQAIVTTFEESLLRKYMSDEAVNVIYLS